MKKVLLATAMLAALSACSMPTGVKHVNNAYDGKLTWNIDNSGQGTGRMVIPYDELFAPAQSYPRPSATRELRKIADTLLADPGLRLSIVSHDHYDGRDNKAFVESQKRAVAIQSIIVSAGVPIHRVVALGAGDRSPVAGNHSPEGRMENRRIEFIFSRGGQ